MREAPFRSLGIRPPPLKAENKKPGQTDVAVCPGVARLKGLEPLTYWFVASHSIQLSYRRMQP